MESSPIHGTPIRKVVITKYDLDPEKCLSVVTEPIPAPKATEVQVAVLYSGFSGADISQSRGVYPFQPSPPFTPGYCFVGRVSALGPACTTRALLMVGDLVTALTVTGSEAERINIEERFLVRVPAHLDPRAVTALTLDWNTAYGMVEGTARVSKDQKVFVHGLSGAVGYALTVLCLRKGAKVYGTASARNHAALKKLGDVTPFVYTDKKWMAAMTEAGGADVVFDPLGFESFGESYSVLASDRPSLLVGYGNNAQTLGDGRAAGLSSQLPQFLYLWMHNLKLWSKRRTALYGISRTSAAFVPDLLSLMELLGSKEIEVPIKAVWDLDDIKEAHRGWGKVEGMGSLLIKVAKESYS